MGVANISNAQQSNDPWIKKSWNNMVAHFNIYFNAEQKLNASIERLADNHKDDFNRVIDIFPYGTEKDAKTIKESLEGAMKKASKVIQNKPNSEWVDDAYFLIGQTQFFSGDYFSAIETFQFVNNSFKDPKIKVQSQLWLMKSFIQQKKYDNAEAILGILQENPIKYPEFKTHLYLVGGDLMVKQHKKAEAIILLNKAIHKIKDKTLRYRTHFVLGQLNLDMGNFEVANSHFIKVLKLNAPYEYVFQANLGMAKSSVSENGQSIQKTKKYLKRMLDDDKNIDYFDQIYFELALLEFSTNNEKAGLSYMQASANNSGKNQIQNTKTYLYLANYFFDKRSYTLAQAYYDTTIAEIPDDFPEVDNIKAKHTVLSKLIENIQVISVQDSLLELSALDRDVLDKKINNLVSEEKEQKLRDAEEEAIRRDQEMLNSNNNSNSLASTTSTGSVWYFYNINGVARGTNDFIRTWGKRTHGDFWRYLNKNSMSNVLLDEKLEEENEDASNPETYTMAKDENQLKALDNVSEDLKKYYENIPFSPLAQIISKKKIQTAYLTIGKIYFEDLRENEKAKGSFNTLINRFPSTEHKPEVLFYLSKIALAGGDSLLARKIAKQIADEFPETVYNQVLNSQIIPEDNNDKEVIGLYTNMYEAYLLEDFKQVFAIKKNIDQNYAGNSIQDKIDYIYALTVGKTQGKEAYIKELEIISDVYQGTQISNIAAFTIRTLQQSSDNKMSENIFDNNLSGVFYYVITGITSQEKEIEIGINQLNEKISSSLPLKVSSILLGNRSMFYVKQFPDQTKAKLYHEELLANKRILVDAGLTNMRSYPITEKNFRKLISNQKELEYLAQFKTTFNP